MPGRYLKFEVARRPSTRRTGADRVQSTFNRAPFDEEVHRSATGRRPAGDRRRPFDARFYLIRSLGSASSIFVVKLYYWRISLHVFIRLTKKIYKWAEKGDLEDTVAAGYCGSFNAEPGGGDVAFGEALEDAP